MARIRSVKPEFFTSETIAALSVPARLTFIGLWTYADDAGRAMDNPKLLKAAVWPLDDDVSAGQVASHLEEFERAGRICRYAIDGKRYLHVVTWEEHQKPKNPSEPKYPACPKQDHGGNDPGDAVPQPYPTPTPAEDQDGASPSLPRAHARSREQGAGSRGSASRVASATAGNVTSIPTAQTFVARYVDAYRGRAGHDPPKRVKGQVARHIGEAFADGVTVEHIKAGLNEWFEANQHPSTIPSFIEVAGRGGRPRTNPTRPQQQRQQIVETDEALDHWAKGGGADGQAGVEEDRGQAEQQLPRPGTTA